jgi:hypothetical protein
MVQARLHELEVGVERQLALDFEPDNVRCENLLSRRADMLAEAQHGRQNQNTRVADLHAAVVVV